MQESNILESSIRAHFDDFGEAKVSQRPENPDLVDLVHELLARPHSHSSNDKVASIFIQLAQNTLMYTGQRYVLQTESIEPT